MRGPLRPALLVGVLAALLIAPRANAALPYPPDQWYGLPGLNDAAGAQWVRAIAYSTPPNVVYAGLEGGGVFKSTNGGVSWSAFNAGFANPLITNVRALLTSSTGTTVWAGTDLGLFKSTGGAWQPVAQGPEDDPANPKKLNESVQALVSLTGSSTMLAGVFSGGVYKSGDGGETWQPPPVNNGMPASETIYGLTENVPGFVYATGGSGVYLSTNGGSTWTRLSDGIPGSASPITTWVYPQRPQVLFTSTGSNGIYRSLNAGLTWSPINDGLSAVRARGFHIFTASQGAHLYAATENGLWHALMDNPTPPAVPPAPKWKAVTQNGLSPNVILWALTPPVIPGAGALGLIAGTQSNGGYFLGFSPPDSACPLDNTTNTTANCPRITGTVQEGKTLTGLNGTWTGTDLKDYSYQWQRCTGTTHGSCSNIADAEETTYLVRAADFTNGYRFRLRITAENPAPTFGVVERYSAITAVTTANPGNVPGANQVFPPGIEVLSPGETTSPEVGDTMRATDGTTPSLPNRDEWFNPPADSETWRWLRCESGGLDCNEIPGATSRTYTLTPADGSHYLRVRVRGTNASGATELTSGTSYFVISAPAAIADPLPPDTPGGAPKSQAPSISGEPFVGETLAGDVGGWKDPTTDFKKRWVRCDAAGNACSYIQKVASTDLEDGSTYVVRAGDVGSTIRMRVTADVNGDLTDDGIDNHLPHSVEVDTAPTAVIAERAVPGGGSPPPAPPSGGGTPPPGTTPPDTVAPLVSGLRLSSKAFVAGKGTTFALSLSEPGTLRIVITRGAPGRKAGRRCVKPTRRNRRAKRCTRRLVVTRITRRGLAAGPVRVKFTGKVKGRKLKPGRYTATFVVTDAAGNVSKARSLTFRIVRKKR